MAKKDYYQILGLKSTASNDEIKKAFRTLSKQYHPDKNQGDKKAEEKFKEINEAYQVLSDPDKKARYDRNEDDEPSFSNMGGFNFSDFFTSRPQIKKGENITLVINLTFEDIFNGTKKQHKYKRTTTCNDCDGIGGTEIEICKQCDGYGQVRTHMKTPFGFIEQSKGCDACDMTGKTAKNKCKTCNGNGVVNTEETIDLEIPRGVENGMAFVMQSKGYARKGCEAGDLIIKINEIQDNRFTRVNKDLKMSLNLSYSQLVLGDKVDIKTIEGTTIKISVPPHTQVGSNLRITNKGTYVYMDNERGDLILNINIKIPNKVNQETKNLLEQLKKSEEIF